VVYPMPDTGGKSIETLPNMPRTRSSVSPQLEEAHRILRSG